jgi:hypothetical protein
MCVCECVIVCVCDCECVCVSVCVCECVCVYNKQTDAHVMTVCYSVSLFTAPTCFNANSSSSGSSCLLPAKLHKCVHAVLVVFL